MEVLTTLDKAAVTAEASAAAALQAACIFLACSELTSPVEKQIGDPSSSVSPHCCEQCQDY